MTDTTDQPPRYWVDQPSDVRIEVRLELDNWIRDPANPTQVATVARLMHEGMTDRNEMVAAGGAANYSAVANCQVTIRVIRDGIIPTKPSYARQNASATRAFLARFKDQLSDDATTHLLDVIERCEAIVGSRQAIEEEDAELEQNSEDLEKELEARGGIYVYTYPHYYRYKTVPNTERTLYKIGKSDRDTHLRVAEQARATAVPEKPVILRTYHSETSTPAEMEHTLHRVLKAADHNSVLGGSREWYETSLEMLDVLASTCGYETRKFDLPE